MRCFVLLFVVFLRNKTYDQFRLKRNQWRCYSDYLHCISFIHLKDQLKSFEDFTN